MEEGLLGSHASTVIEQWFKYVQRPIVSKPRAAANQHNAIWLNSLTAGLAIDLTLLYKMTL
jgi:hypothetical protein